MYWSLFLHRDRVRVGGIGLEGGETTFCGDIGDVEADSELYNLG